MALPPKTPPRFVPTLTEVVQVPGTPATPGMPEAASQPAASMLTAALIPPQLSVPGSALAASVVPAVHTPAVKGPSSTHALRAAPLPIPAHTTALVAQALPARSMPAGLEEYIVHRVMQRVDGVLDKRLREAIATVVQEQTRSVLPRLREEIESVVRHAVYESIADEIASGARPAAGG